MPALLDTHTVHIVLSLTSTPPLISTPRSLKMNLFISPHHQKPYLHYKMPEILVKLNIFLCKRLKLKMMAKHYRKSTEKVATNFFFAFILAFHIDVTFKHFQSIQGTNMG